MTIYTPTDDQDDIAIAEKTHAASTSTAKKSIKPKTAEAVVMPTVDSNQYSHESERLVISVMMNETRKPLHHELMSLLSPDDFFVEQHKIIWETIFALRESGLESDPTSIVDHTANNGEFIGGSDYILDAARDPIARHCSSESVTAAAQRIKDFGMSRKLHKTLTQALALSSTGQNFASVSGFTEDALINLAKLCKTSRGGPKAAHFFYDALMANLEAKLDGADAVSGVLTGFEDTDNVMGGGLPKESLIVIAGRPGMGKTAFSTALEQNISNRGIPTLFFSLEMTGLSLAQRNVSRHSRIPFRNIKMAEIAEHDYGNLLETIDFLGRAPCYIDETPGLSLSEIRARAREFNTQHPNGVIFVDYLQIVQPSRDSKHKDPRYLIGETSQGLLQLARELRCPVVALSQLSRSVETRVNKRPIMSDLRESGQIEQDASVILFLYRDEVYNKDKVDNLNITEVIFAKNREGETKTIKFNSDLSRMLYSEIGVCETVEE